MTKKIIVPTGVMFREVGGEAVILNINDERYYGLDDVGTRIWHALASSANVEEALGVLLEEFDVEEAQLKADIDELIGDLQKSGLLEVSDAD